MCAVTWNDAGLRPSQPVTGAAKMRTNECWKTAKSAQRVPCGPPAQVSRSSSSERRRTSHFRALHRALF